MPTDTKFVYQQHQLANMIALYESYLTDIESNLISQRQMTEKGETFLQWVNDLLGSKIRKVNQIVEHSISIFRQLQSQELEISTRMLELEHNCAQRNTTIQNHLYTIKSMETRLSQRQNDIYKLKQQITELTQKLQKQENRFKREAKEFKKTFRIIQENTESDKQIFDSIQLEYEYQKHQKDQLRSQLQMMKEEFTAVKKQLDEVKRLLKASENKLEWQVKKKISLQDVVKEKNTMIEKLLTEINDLKDTLKNPYDQIDQDHLHQRDSDYLHMNQPKSLQKNILSEEMAFRQSFSSEVDIDDQYARRNSMRKSFDEGSGYPSEGNLDYVVGNQEQAMDNHQLNSRHLKSNKSSFYHESAVSKEEAKTKVHSNQKIIVHPPHTLLIHDMHKPLAVESSEVSQTENSSRKLLTSPSAQINNIPPAQINNINQNSSTKQQRPTDDLQIITQKVQSDSQPLNPIHRCAPDLYFAHFLLTSQSVKIKEDCQEMLNIDVKQYYPEIIQKRIPMHIWDDWIREKLRLAVKKVKESYDAERRRSSVSGWK